MNDSPNPPPQPMFTQEQNEFYEQVRNLSLFCRSLLMDHAMGVRIAVLADLIAAHCAGHERAQERDEEVQRFVRTIHSLIEMYVLAKADTVEQAPQLGDVAPTPFQQGDEVFLTTQHTLRPALGRVLLAGGLSLVVMTEDRNLRIRADGKSVIGNLPLLKIGDTTYCLLDPEVYDVVITVTLRDAQRDDVTVQ
jgi:hypothetical protein